MRLRILAVILGALACDSPSGPVGPFYPPVDRTYNLTSCSVNIGGKCVLSVGGGYSYKLDSGRVVLHGSGEVEWHLYEHDTHNPCYSGGCTTPPYTNYVEESLSGRYVIGALGVTMLASDTVVLLGANVPPLRMRAWRGPSQLTYDATNPPRFLAFGGKIILTFQ